MGGAVKGALALGRRGYHDPDFAMHEKSLDDMARSGAGGAEAAAYIRRVYVERNRSIRNADFRHLEPKTVEEDYLLPRRDLSRFVVANWVSRVFIPSLKPALACEIFLFGLGRLFSAYNDLGVQHCTDADINVIVSDSVPRAGLESLAAALRALKAELLEHFGIDFEFNPEYTILPERTVIGRLGHPDDRARLECTVFYKSNERSIDVIKDHGGIRENVFSRVRHLPDSKLFENFLGLGAGRTTYAKLRTDREPLVVEDDVSGERLKVRTVVGSRAFGLYCRRSLPYGLFVSPPEWHFSMKYFVNRVYDYVCAMQNLGHGLAEIGFDRPGAGGEPDPDFLYLRGAHKLMLYLQEILQLGTATFSSRCDYSYMSRGRFLRLMELDGDKFRGDFGEMVASGGLLQASELQKYRALLRKIESKARDRFVRLDAGERARLPPGFRYEVTSRGADECVVCVPFSWGDLGFFVFSTIASRIARIVEGRLLPALPGLGMPREEYGAYLAAFSA